LLDNIIQTSGELGMKTLETSLSQAVKEGRISVETATAYAVRPEELGRLLKQ
jgi:Tfp pilus assembly pilus retraction ATPase PilT